MTAETDSVAPVSCCPDGSGQGGSMDHCPMAARFNEIFVKSRISQYLLLVGALLFILAIAIVVEPKILIWLMASVSALAGIGLLMAAYYLNRIVQTNR